jgi:ornithine cyclodeaminase/alanine dehydrogenase-like protein (mu-crystallin family)
MLVLSRRDVEAALDPDRLVDAVAAAMADLSRGNGSFPNRTGADVAEVDGVLIAMPAYLAGAGALAAKLVAMFPQNAARGLPTHKAIVAAFDPATGTPAALMDGEVVTALRTAACSALSTRLLGREDASVLAILGTGVQARAHAEAVRRVRPIRELRVAGRDAAKARTLAAELDGIAVASFEDAVSGADVVCACTHSPEPVVRAGWVRPGAHITSVGYNPQGHELDADLLARALVVVEARAAALAPYPSGSNDLLWPIRDGVFDERHIHAEIGELVSGARPGRTSADQITVYKSVGVAAQDAAAAALALEAARERGLGTQIEI